MATEDKVNGNQSWPNLFHITAIQLDRIVFGVKIGKTFLLHYDCRMKKEKNNE